MNRMTENTLSLKKELEAILDGDVADDAPTLTEHSHDASLFEVVPQVVVYPKGVSDVKKLVAFAVEKRGTVSLTARAGGTDMTGGPLSESIVMDFTRYFNHMGNVANMQASAEPGVYYRDFEKETMKHNWMMPAYPASRELCAIGGIVANNSGGEKTLVYGKTADYVQELKVVLADGNEHVIKPISAEELEIKKKQNDFEGALYYNIYELIEKNRELIARARPQVSKNSSGYALWDVWDGKTFDLTKVFVGSQGTLGMITEATFKLVEPEPNAQMAVVFLDDLSELGDIVKTVLAHKPATFESYDDQTLKLAIKFFFSFVKRLGFKNIFTLVINGIPEALSILRYGLPKLVLQVTFEGKDPAQLKEKAQNMVKDLEKYNPRYTEVIKHKAETDEYWLVRRESFNLLRHKVQNKKTAPFIDDIVVPPDTLTDFLPKLNAILEPYKKYMVYNIAGHIGNGNFHIIPLMDLSQKENREVIPEIADKVYDLVLSYGGSITGEHNDGIIRTPYIEQMFGKEMNVVFEELKHICDPDNIFNPHKKTKPYSSGFMEGHMKIK